MNILDAYTERFGEIDTFSLRNVVEPAELIARMQRALDEDKPIDVAKEYGLAPAPDDADL